MRSVKKKKAGPTALVHLALQSAQLPRPSAQVVVPRPGLRLLEVALALLEALQRRSQRKSPATGVCVVRVGLRD